MIKPARPPGVGRGGRREVSKMVGTTYDELERLGVSWDELESLSITWEELESGEAITKIKESRRRPPEKESTSAV